MLVLLGFSGSAFAVAGAESSTTAITPESAMPQLTASEIIALKKVAEQQKLDQYSGVIGTAPLNKTISATGASLEETQTGPQLFLFWTQTLANGLYYEGRLYGKYNMRTQNPAFPTVPASDENNPPGYKAVFKIGYNFHVTDTYYMTPYLRLEAGKNMTLVYQDVDGDYTHSTSTAILPGFKQTFKLTNLLVPYIDIYGGYTKVNLNGELSQGASAMQFRTAEVNQISLTNELGAAYRITDSQSITPYLQFIYTANNPNALAAQSYANGGFNVSELTSNSQVYAIKYSYAW